jgi:hypothetical protein
MTRDDIIQMAKEACSPDAPFRQYVGNVDCGLLMRDEHLERFAALVAAPLEEEIKRLRFCIPEGDAAAAMEYLAYCVEKAVAAEREQCAWMAQNGYASNARDIAAAIRARGK